MIYSNDVSLSASIDKKVINLRPKDYFSLCKEIKNILFIPWNQKKNPSITLT